MTRDEAYEKRRRECIALERENKKLKERIAEYDNGTYESAIMSDHLKQISKLTWENKRLRNERDRYKANWQTQISVTENFRVAGAEGFTSQELYGFLHSIDALLELANSEHKESIGRYYENNEQSLITRIDKYKDNHFLWAKDFSIAPTNNLAERSLRGQKVKLKVSGQFQSVETAGFFADIRTYTETCYRNGIDTFEALVRLANGNPFTLKEVLGEA